MYILSMLYERNKIYLNTVENLNMSMTMMLDFYDIC